MPTISIAAPVTLDAVGDRDAIAAVNACRFLLIKQDISETAVGYFLSNAASGGNEEEEFPASPHIFQHKDGTLIQPGEIVGYGRVASGSASFIREEGLP